MKTLFECGLVVNGSDVRNRLVFNTPEQDIGNMLKYKWMSMTEDDFTEAVKCDRVIFYDMIDGVPRYNVQGEDDVRILSQLPRMVNYQSQRLYLDNYSILLPKFNQVHFDKALNNPKVIACSVRGVTMYMNRPFISAVCFNKQLGDFIGYVYERFGNVSVNTRWENTNVAELLLPLDMLEDKTFMQGEYKVCLSKESIESLKELEGDARKVWHANKNIMVANNKALDLILDCISEINASNEAVEFITDYVNLDKYFGECGFSKKEEQDKEIERLMSLFKVDNLADLNEKVVVLISNE